MIEFGAMPSFFHTWRQQINAILRPIEGIDP